MPPPGLVLASTAPRESIPIKMFVWPMENLATAGRIRLKDHTNYLNKHTEPQH